MIEWIKKNLVLTIVIVIVAGTVAFVGGIKLADKPFFCGMLCHEMQPHADSLKANFHGGKEVICMDCHSEQGFINHAIEHIAALSLLGGHFSKAYLEDEFAFHKNVQGFNAEEMNFKGKTDTEEEKKLFEKCRECHPNRMDKSYYMKVPEHKKEMITENCIRCHEEVEAQKQEGEPAKTALSDFSKPRKIANIHPVHIGKKVLCIECHHRVVHSNDPAVHVPDMGVCFRCHNKGGKAPEVDCKGCHLGQLNLIKGIGAKEVAESASFMADTECTECHSKNMKFDIETCVGCHDDTYKTKLTEYKNNYKAKFDEASKLYEEITKAIAEGKNPGASESILKRAEFNFKYASLDGSKGMHNPDFIDSLFTKVMEDLNEVKKALK